jgi:hypothetical protein
VSGYDDQEPHYVQDADEMPEAERDPEIGPQEATWADTEDALFAARMASVTGGTDTADFKDAERTFEAVDAAYGRAQARGWAAQAETDQEAGQ